MSDINDLTTILERCAGISPGSQDEFREYHHALEFCWNGSGREGIEAASSALMKNPAHAFEPAMYRLWTEMLIRDGDLPSLRMLDQHLLLLSVESDECRAYRGLRGLINLELDNWEACELIHLAVKDVTDCNYCLEFLQYFYNRVTPSDELLPVSLLQHGKNVTDYFHWDSLSDALVWQGRYHDLQDLRKKQSEIFPDSPALNYSEAMLHIMNNEFSDACRYTGKLHQDYPGNDQFGFMHGFANCRLEQYEPALKALQSIEENPGLDPDTTAYKAFCHHKLSRNDILSFHWEKALTLYEKARNGYEANGLPSTDVSYLKSLQTHHLKTKQSDGVLDKDHKIRYWITPLPALTQGELNTSAEEDIKVIHRSIGKKPAPFDLVFMVSEDISQKDAWKISALYFVAMGPVPHPVKRWESTLHLVKRFSSPVSLDLILSDEKDRRSKPRPDDTTRYNMLEIDEAAFDTIREVISEESRFLNEPVDFENLYSKIS